MMLKYIGFHGRRQQVCHGKPLFDSGADIGCRYLARRQLKAGKHLFADGDVES
jgi:hypothetical protein